MKCTIDLCSGMSCFHLKKKLFYSLAVLFILLISSDLFCESLPASMVKIRKYDGTENLLSRLIHRLESENDVIPNSHQNLNHKDIGLVVQERPIYSGAPMEYRKSKTQKRKKVMGPCYKKKKGGIIVKYTCWKDETFCIGSAGPGKRPTNTKVLQN